MVSGGRVVGGTVVGWVVVAGGVVGTDGGSVGVIRPNAHALSVRAKIKESIKTEIIRDFKQIPPKTVVFSFYHKIQQGARLDSSFTFWQTDDKIRKDTDRDHFLNAYDALEYGIIDEVLKK